MPTRARLADHRAGDLLGRRQLRHGPDGRPGEGRDPARRRVAGRRPRHLRRRRGGDAAREQDRRADLGRLSRQAPPGDTASRCRPMSRSRSAGRTMSPAAIRSSRPRSSPDSAAVRRSPYFGRRWRACGSSSRVAAARAGRSSCATCVSTAMSPQRRLAPRRPPDREDPGHRPDRPRPDPGRPGRRRCRRPFRRDPGARAPTRGRDVPHQRAVDLQRLPGGGRSPRETGGLGVERDGPRAPVRHPAGLRADRRDRSNPILSRPIRCRSSSARRWRRSSPAAAGSASSGCGSRTSWRPRTTPPSRRTGTTPASASGTCGATSTRATWRRGATRARGPDRGRRGGDHRRGRDVHDPAQRGPDGRGLPGCPAASSGRGSRNAARDRPCPPAPRLRTGPPLGGPRQRVTAVTPERGGLPP